MVTANRTIVDNNVCKMKIDQSIHQNKGWKKNQNFSEEQKGSREKEVMYPKPRERRRSTS